jgi:hypothetical protein
MPMHKVLLALPAVLFAACDDDPVSYSEPVGLALSVTSGSVEGDSLRAEKNVNTESGNPYAAFVARAEAAIGGSPSRIAVEGAALSLDATSRNVVVLTEVFAGVIDVAFVMNASRSTYPVADLALEPDAGAGPAAMVVRFDSGDMPDADHGDVVSGSFKAVLSGPAAAGFATLDADADVSLVLTFAAYE